MLFRSLLSFLALAAFLACGGATTSSSDLTLPYLFSIELQAAADFNPIDYPYGGGQRLNIALTNGTMSTPGNETMATLVPGFGGEQGVFREDGIFLIDARVVFQVEQSFDPDRKFAFLQIRGKSLFLSDGTVKGLTFIELETDSPAFAYLNRHFLAGKLTCSGTTLQVDVSGGDPSAI